MKNNMVKAYNIPIGKRISEGISLFVNGSRVGAFDTEVNNTHEWKQDFSWTLSAASVGIFDFTGTAEIKIHTEFKVEDVTVRPLASEIHPVVTQCEDGSTDISFTLTDNTVMKNSYGQYVLEFNNDRNKAMFLFAGRIEKRPEGDVFDIKSGTSFHGDIRLEEGQTLYIEGGAAVYGRVYPANNSRICGRGIIDGSHHANWAWNPARAFNPVDVTGCTNVRIEGISILNPPCWVCQIVNSTNVCLDNVKIISAKANSDGITIQSSSDVYVDNCFIRSWDDSIVIKGVIKDKNPHDIYVNNCLIWTDLAQSMEIGFETNKGMSDKPEIYNIEFKNVTVLHQLHKASLSIHNADDAEIHDILWENITIEELDVHDSSDGWNIWFDITNIPAGQLSIPGSSPAWTTVEKRSTIHDITLRNIKIIDNKSGGTYRIMPMKENEDVYNIKAENAADFSEK